MNDLAWQGFHCAEEMDKDGFGWVKIIKEAETKAISGRKDFANGMMNYVSHHMPEAHDESESNLWERVNNIKSGLLS